MSDLDQILARARAPGQFVERRHFTLSRARAIEKLREFALRRPGQAVLELVQAAVFAGATYIAIDTHPDRLVVAWVGTPPLLEDQLEHLLDYLFADTANPGQRHLVQVAIAVNAMLRDEGGRVRIESGSGKPGETLRLDLEADGQGSVGSPEGGLAGTYVAMERPRKWWKFWQRTTVTEEQVLVEEQCRYTPVPILLNGSAPFGYRASRQIRAFHQGDDLQFDEGHGGRRGSLYLTPMEGRVDVVVGGVRVTTVDLFELGLVQTPGLGGGLPHRFSGVVCDDYLRKTADQSDIVRDDRFQDLLHALRGPTIQLARRFQSTWTSPIPERVQRQAGAVALPDPIDQLAPRPRISLDALFALPSTIPLFSMTPAVAAEAAVQLAADPQRLPFPILVLPREASRQLQADLGRPVGTITDPGSVDLAVRAAAGASGLLTLDGRQVDQFGRVWRAMVWPSGHHLGLTEPGVVPVLLLRDGRTTEVRGLPLDAPGLCVLLDGALPDLLPEAALRDLVLRHTARVVIEDASVPLPLRCRLLAQVVRLVPTAGPQFQLEAPPGWSPADIGGSLAAWSDAADRGERLVVPADVAAAWDPLERVLGVGFLGTSPHGRPEVVVAAGPSGWTPTDQPPGDGTPHLVARDGPPPPTHRSFEAEPLLTFPADSPPPPREAAEALMAALEQVVSSSPRQAALRRRWTEGLARAYDEPAWSTLRDPDGYRLLAGPREPGHHHTPLPCALARTMGLLDQVGFPAWARSGELDGGWATKRTFDTGWLAIPRTVPPHIEPPRILIDTGLDHIWFSTEQTLPCVGVLRHTHPSTSTLWPLITDLWLDLLERPDDAPSAWVAFAARVVPPESILAERLAQQAAGPADRSFAQQALLEALDRLGTQDQTEHWLLEHQARLLREALGGVLRRTI